MSKQGASILVIDDEIKNVRVLRRSLRAHGYSVLTATNGEEAINVTTEQHPDLLLLDLMLPGMSGLEVCRAVRAMSNVPILVFSTKDSEREKVQALDLGADDYIPKPFRMSEVLAHIRVTLGSVAREQTEAALLFGPLAVDFACRQVQLHGRDIPLTPTEYHLLKMFFIHRGKILTQQMLFMLMWGEVTQAHAQSLRSSIAKLRHKIEPDPQQPCFILTIPGVGYRFNDEIALPESPFSAS